MTRRKRLAPTETKPPVQPVRVRRLANPETARLALELAGGDARRLRYNDDGTVTILNDRTR